MRSHFFLHAALALALSSVAAAQTAPSTVAATTQHFELYSDPWINLHHFLYHWTRQDAGLNAGRRPVIVGERASLAGMPDTARTQWLRALEFYRSAIAHKGHFDLDMIELKWDLAQLSGDTKARPPNRIEGIADALSAAMPIYLERWWPHHNKANRTWIFDVAGPLRRHEAGFAAMTSRVHGAVWPTERWRVDVTAYANAGGGYTTRDGHVIVYSTDPATQDLHGLEMIFHEIQHARLIGGSTPAALDAAFAAVGVEVPGNLGHAMIFATAGEYVRSIAAREGHPRYQPYWIAQGFERFVGWQQLVPAVNQHWLPVVRGETTTEAGLAALVQAFRK